MDGERKRHGNGSNERDKKYENMGCGCAGEMCRLVDKRKMHTEKTRKR